MSRSTHTGIDREIQEEIWTEYYPKLYVFVRPYFRDSPEDREDAVQEIILKVFRNIDRYDSKFSFSTWIYRIARNHCIDMIRKKKNRPGTLDLESLDHRTAVKAENGLHASGSDPAEIVIRKETVAEVGAVIEKLPETDRQLCFLRIFEELSFGEISVILGRPAGTLKYRMFRIRSRLKQSLNEDHGG